MHIIVIIMLLIIIIIDFFLLCLEVCLFYLFSVCKAAGQYVFK